MICPECDRPLIIFTHRSVTVGGDQWFVFLCEYCAIYCEEEFADCFVPITKGSPLWNLFLEEATEPYG